MYIDIHLHKRYEQEDVILLQNLFPHETDKSSTSNFYSVGLHPWYIKENTMYRDIELVRKAAEKQNFIAIGEIGLDAKIDVVLDLQMKVFIQQLNIADNLKKPVIIHCERAYNELLSVRKNSDQRIPWIIHWFNGSKQMAEDLIGKNCYLSYGQMLFRENSKAFRAFRELPQERIFFETDDIGISIIEIYEKASKCLDISIEKLKNQITENFRNCFGDLL